MVVVSCLVECGCFLNGVGGSGFGGLLKMQVHVLVVLGGFFLARRTLLQYYEDRERGSDYRLGCSDRVDVAKSEYLLGNCQSFFSYSMLVVARTCPLNRRLILATGTIYIMRDIASWPTPFQSIYAGHKIPCSISVPFFSPNIRVRGST